MANQFKEKLKRDEVVVVVNPDHPSSSLTEFVAAVTQDGQICSVTSRTEKAWSPRSRG